MNTNTQNLANVVESGLHPASAPTLDRKVMELTANICSTFTASVRESLTRITQAERAAVARLEQYVPTERLLDRHEAAAYLKLKLRQLDALSSPRNPLIPFNRIGGLKRFQKNRLDKWLDDSEVKARSVTL
ncbi:MAG: hypothetical protein QOH88_26 [Verrucomicrobiota bacterium]|jgi:hypothetical protein